MDIIVRAYGQVPGSPRDRAVVPAVHRGLQADGGRMQRVNR